MLRAWTIKYFTILNIFMDRNYFKVYSYNYDNIYSEKNQVFQKTQHDIHLKFFYSYYF